MDPYQAGRTVQGLRVWEHTYDAGNDTKNNDSNGKDKNKVRTKMAITMYT